jgi:peptidoglycan-N-acetylglucosamine deacetylase
MWPDHGSRASALAAGAALAAVHALPALAKPLPAVGRMLRVDATTSSGVALTFDDGPHPQGTTAVLEALREHGAVATFFLVGEQIVRAPGLAAEIAAAGHAVAVHCHRHRNMLRLTPAQVREDVERALDLVRSTTGVDPEWHRPPYGVYSFSGLRAARRAGLRPLLWTHWGRDWRAGATADSIAGEATAGLQAGAVVLLHDVDTYSCPGSWRRTAAALPAILDRVHAAGLAVRKL